MGYINEKKIKKDVDKGLNWLQRLWLKVKEFFKELF